MTASPEADLHPALTNTHSLTASPCMPCAACAAMHAPRIGQPPQYAERIHGSSLNMGTHVPSLRARERNRKVGFFSTFLQFSTAFLVHVLVVFHVLSFHV